MSEPDWHAARTLEEALALRAEHGDELTVVAGGTFLGLLLRQRVLEAERFLALRDVAGLDRIAVLPDGTLELGAMARHRAVESAPEVLAGWPALARAFALVANTRVRNQATVGGVLADADYASDPPSMLVALGAEAVLRGPAGERRVPVEELIVGYYQTTIAPDELLVAVRVPGGAERSTYRKFRSRSHEDRPCVCVAAAWRAGALRVAVGAVSGRPQLFPGLCADADAAEIGRRYAEAIEPISDLRGSEAYRRRVIAVEVRRAVEELGQA